MGCGGSSTARTVAEVPGGTAKGRGSSSKYQKKTADNVETDGSGAEKTEQSPAASPRAAPQPRPAHPKTLVLSDLLKFGAGESTISDTTRQGLFVPSAGSTVTLYQRLYALSVGHAAIVRMAPGMVADVSHITPADPQSQPKDTDACDNAEAVQGGVPDATPDGGGSGAPAAGAAGGFSGVVPGSPRPKAVEGGGVTRQKYITSNFAEGFSMLLQPAEEGLAPDLTFNMEDALVPRMARSELRGINVRVIGGYSRSIGAISFSQNGMLVAVAQGWQRVPGNAAAMARSPSVRKSLPASPNRSLSHAPSPKARSASGALSPTSRRTNCSMDQSQAHLSLSLINAFSAEPLGSFTAKGYLETICSICFGYNDERIYTCSDDGTVQTWLLNKKRTGSKLKKHTGIPNMIGAKEVKISPDGLTIGVCGEDSDNECRGQVLLWYLDNLKPLVSFRGHPARCSTFDFHPNSTVVVSGDITGIVIVWAVENSRILRVVMGHTYPLTKVFFVNHFSENSEVMKNSHKVTNPCLSTTMLCTADDKFLRGWTFPDLNTSEVHEGSTCHEWHPSANPELIVPVWTRGVNGNLHPFDKDAVAAPVDPGIPPSPSMVDRMGQMWADVRKTLAEHFYEPEEAVLMQSSGAYTRRKYTLTLPVPTGMIMLCTMTKELLFIDAATGEPSVSAMLRSPATAADVYRNGATVGDVWGNVYAVDFQMANELAD